MSKRALKLYQILASPITRSSGTHSCSRWVSSKGYYLLKFVGKAQLSVATLEKTSVNLMDQAQTSEVAEIATLCNMGRASHFDPGNSNTLPSLRLLELLREFQVNQPSF